MSSGYMQERRKDHAMRRLVEKVVDGVAAGRRDTRNAAGALRVNGVPLRVAVRLLGRRPG